MASRTLEQLAYINQIKYEVHTEQGDALCEMIPTVLGNNPGKVACKFANLIPMIISFIIWQIAETAYTAIRYMYEDATASAEQEYNGYIASVATYDELKNYMPWSVEALGVMNVNMVEQHIEMTKVLQKRHTQMEININTYNMCGKTFSILSLQYFLLASHSSLSQLHYLIHSIQPLGNITHTNHHDGKWLPRQSRGAQ